MVGMHWIAPSSNALFTTKHYL